MTSTLNYLDPDGHVNFLMVPWTRLNEWLSKLNGIQKDIILPEGINRGKVIEELEDRRQNKTGIVKRVIHRDGYKDWRKYFNEDGLDHFEELLVFQPPSWRVQAREYYFKYGFDINASRYSEGKIARPCISLNLKGEVHYANDDEIKESSYHTIEVTMTTPIAVVLFHPSIPKSKRYEPLFFLLAYDVKSPIKTMIKKNEVKLQGREIVGEEKFSTETLLEKSLVSCICPLDYFLTYQKNICPYKFDALKAIGRLGVPRLPLIKELNFGNVFGQRLSKFLIQREVVSWIQERNNSGELLDGSKKPLSLIFAGPSGNGKTELAQELAFLLNSPASNCYHKVDCGKLSDSYELFGMSGPYQGAFVGSALNNFILDMSEEPKSIGIVLLDELDKAKRDVCSALYQVLDKGEWTNKKLQNDVDKQTKVISCKNIIFIMTANVADEDIVKYAKKHDEIYTAAPNDLEYLADDAEDFLAKSLRKSGKFADAFLGRIECFIPFFPLSKGTSTSNILCKELDTVAHFLIEREIEYPRGWDDDIKQNLSAATKKKMVEIIVGRAIAESGIRSVQKLVKAKMSKRILHAALSPAKCGGIGARSSIHYHADVDNEKIFFRQSSNLDNGVPSETNSQEDDINVADFDLS